MGNCSDNIHTAITRNENSAKFSGNCEANALELHNNVLSVVKGLNIPIILIL